MKRYATKCFLPLVCLITGLNACKSDNKNPQTTASENRASLIQVDKEFSKRCLEKGMKMAFIEYLDSNGVLIRPYNLPIVGANAIDYLIRQDDSAYELSWQPGFADVSSSGDLGYTYGVYELRFKDKDSTAFGTYVSIWKKQADGQWKFVLDVGNEGTGNE